MGKQIEYAGLYALQDKVLKLVSELGNDFYLTGGTAIHRFYFNARYSNDLDFFVSSGDNFKEDADEIVNTLKLKGYEVDAIVRTRDFNRYMINSLLQLDFVNDRVFRYGKSVFVNGIRIDNKMNILTNKVGAIIDRDEEKDFFDVFCFAFYESFNWGDVLRIANQKAVIEKDVFVYRLSSFPLQWLDRIKIIKELNISKSHVEKLCDDILNENDNRLKHNINN